MANVLDLHDAIEGLYGAFAIYPPPSYTDPCLHCHSTYDEAKLHSLPLRELGISELRDYAADALLVWGGVSDFKHFLPRIFELFVTVDDPGLALIDPEILFSKFRYGQWLTWPEGEQAAIRKFLMTLWKRVLSNSSEGGDIMDIESWLCTIAQAEDDLSPYLNLWIEDSTSSASFALSALLLSGGMTDPGRNNRNAFWGDREAQYRQVHTWANSAHVLQRLQRARAEANDPKSADEFEAALGILDPARLDELPD